MAEFDDHIQIDSYLKPVKPDPKETAKELEAAFTVRAYVINPSQAKRCALVCVDEIMKVITFANYKIWNNEPMNLEFLATSKG